ncbi:CHASE2 domain-containing protein [Leptolyngbya cf. ectocarpi LEGE 11479]|uniref:CHASE2 domain-containing protein n=1 Tax=Leptolyngbya cf. ectocarpi LEGE 11479 TaxID=1828722 RepID=A0A928ZX51_LEPEC|nr:CHASE2 domain-containing protein [Leptolyngbya ectocarpi]MBE9069059.1 CHASE2 domain-containing protein [Leptolyngbya cf. ectocarpi LEGE 11479]
MKQRVLLTMGPGSWQQGFASVTLQLWEAGSIAPIQFSGSLPAAPDLNDTFQKWRSLYVTLYGNYGFWRRSAAAALRSANDFPIEMDDDDITNVSTAAFEQLGQDLRQRLNDWLESDTFRPVERQLRTHVSRNDEIRIMMTAENPNVLRYPWQLWQLFEDYPQSELALSPINYQRSLKKPQVKDHNQVSVLAVLGNAEGINVSTDQQILVGLPGAAVTLLAEPSLDELHQHLWHGTWDIFFFAGHSSSENQGVLQLNSTDTITLMQLKYALRTAIAQGLQLAIFNSCDGLGLAWDLADLNIPQVIVMREPVPDVVAQVFLRHFLTAFAAGQPLYLAVRAAREQLQPLESLCPCATWLPVIVQNPAEQTTSWQELREGPNAPSILPTVTPTSTPHLSRLASLWVPCLATATVMALRLLGGLQSAELAALDWLMGIRPAERPDPRLLVITISETDIQSQPAERRGSLSDGALAKLLDTLDQHQARVIGLDIYRDYSVGPDYPALMARLRQGKNLVGVCKSRDRDVDPVGVAPPPELDEVFVGFSDFIDDPDGVVRRQLVALEADPASSCTTPYAFSARLAFVYLQDEGMTATFNQAGNLVLGEATFPRLRSRSSGYQPIDAGGYQTLLNYRALPTPGHIADQVSLTQVLKGQVNPAAIRDRIVLIGVTANSITDDWATPYGASSSDKTAGVFVQAQMTSQLISAALGERPVLRVWPFIGDVLWLGFWAMVGWRAMLTRQLRWRLMLAGASLVLLLGSSLLLLTGGIWVPLVPAALTWVGGGLGIAARRRSPPFPRSSSPSLPLSKT